VSKKNKSSQVAKRRQKKLEKRRVAQPGRAAHYKREQTKKRTSRIAHQIKTLQAVNLMKDGVQVPDITDDEYVFWLCHGANFLVSNEEDGLWEPMFEGIYDGRLPDPEAVAHTVLGKYASEMEADSEEFSGTPKTVLAWTLTEKPMVRVYKYEAERRLLEKDPECDAAELARQPHNPVVWGLMSEVKQRSLSASKAPEQSNPQEVVNEQAISTVL